MSNGGTNFIDPQGPNESVCPHPNGDIEEHYHLYHGKEFYDGVHGKSLEKERIIRARKLEMNACRFVPRLTVTRQSFLG